MPAKPNSSTPTPRAWQRMLSGRRLDILSPSPLDIEIEDIAHGLARVTRWNGQTKGTYGLSVAQHSLLVEGILSRNAPQLAQKWRLAGLIHDAPEYVIGDMITPVQGRARPPVPPDRSPPAGSSTYSLRPACRTATWNYPFY